MTESKPKLKSHCSTDDYFSRPTHTSHLNIMSGVKFVSNKMINTVCQVWTIVRKTYFHCMHKSIIRQISNKAHPSVVIMCIITMVITSWSIRFGRPTS